MYQIGFIDSKEINNISIRHKLRAGDAGYVTYMHGWIYQQEYDYSLSFEGYVAQSFYEFLMKYTEGRDRLWVAEYEGEIIGCIGIVDRGEKAQLRWYLIHPDFRGIGLGKKLIKEALDFCRKVGYESIYLDTTSELKQAISLYERFGFKKVSQKENQDWKGDVTEEEYVLFLKEESDHD